MKLVSLNTWGATQGQIFFDFIKEQSADTDVFCFQEIFSSLPGAPKVSSGARSFLFEELSRALPSFAGFFDPKSFGADFSGLVGLPLSHGLAIFVKKDLQIVNYYSQVLEVHDIN